MSFSSESNRLLKITMLPWLGYLLIALSPMVSRANDVSFEATIRPILSDACFRCHGPDASNRKADLRLDQEATAKGMVDGRWIIKEGDSSQSLLLERILSEDPSEVMPPPESGKELSPEQKSHLKTWIEQGAPWGTHWAFKPLVRPAVPEVKDNDWPINAIDYFILSKLEQQGLRPSKAAKPATLIRRLHLDLVGLPPSVETARRFAESEDPATYGQMLEGLLAAPGYGERLSTHWLDLVRYADTVGYHGDQPYTVWPYRDYVIRAFNSNMPFDRFTREQIAGDLLPQATRDQKIASGFNRLHMITAEGGAQDKEYLAKYAADRVRTTSNVWMGATMACAECHDHKFDPYSMKDFYSFASFFADLKEKGFYGGSNWEPEMPLPDTNQAKEQADLRERIQQLEKQTTTMTEALTQSRDQWLEQLHQWGQSGHLSWEPMIPQQLESDQGTELSLQADGSILTRGPKPDGDDFTLIWKAQAERRVGGIRLEALPHPSMDNGSFSREGGNFVLAEIECIVEQGEEIRRIEFESASASYAQKGFEASKAIDGNAQTGWAVDGKERKEPSQLLLIPKESIMIQSGDRITLRLKHSSNHKREIIGHFRLATIVVDQPVLTQTGLSQNLYGWATQAFSERSQEDLVAIDEMFLKRTHLLDGARQSLQAAEARLKQLESEIPTMLVSMSVTPRTMRILPRGNWMDESGPEVNPALPEFLMPEKPRTDERRLSRLDLANWLTSEENPLTARVFVNRLWKLYFGHGLARVMEDSGSQGSPPTHPELLDWLASEFVRSGWDIKHMVTLMVSSRSYQQSSTTTPTLRKNDPSNRWFARQTSYRLDAEIIRDQALQLSGLITRKIGGQSNRPYQPEGYYSQLNFPKRTYKPDDGSQQYRRGLYTHWQRTFLHPMLKAFDAPNREECTAARPRSNTPLQSLNLLNDPSFVEAASRLADSLMNPGMGNERSRIASAFETITLRAPTYKELSILQDLLNDMRDAQQNAPQKDEQGFIKVGIEPTAASMQATERDAWVAVARALLNLHETITRY